MRIAALALTSADRDTTTATAASTIAAGVRAQPSASDWRKAMTTSEPVTNAEAKATASHPRTAPKFPIHST
jgi:hypothetical protein